MNKHFVGCAGMEVTASPQLVTQGGSVCPRCPYLGHQAAQDVEGLAPHERQLAHGYPVHGVGVPVLLIHLQEKPGGQQGTPKPGMLKETSPSRFGACQPTRRVSKAPLRMGPRYTLAKKK